MQHAVRHTGNPAQTEARIEVAIKRENARRAQSGAALRVAHQSKQAIAAAQFACNAQGNVATAGNQNSFHVPIMR